MANPNQSIKYTKLFINNEFVDAKSGKTITVINPATGKPIVEVSLGDHEDIEIAYQAAAKAFERGSVWRNLDASARGVLLNRLADLVERDANIIANIESLDAGKPINGAHSDIKNSVAALRYYAGYADKIHGKTIPADYGLFSMTRLEPVGVVGQIIPWNYPLLMLAWKWAPAIAAGCPIIMKPSELTPLSALYMAALSKEAGFPAGVINIVNGYGATVGHALSAHPKISKVAFTGSVAVGKLIMETAAKTNLKRVALELGGKSPLVVFGDADVKLAASVAHACVFINSGQNCIAATRTFVHEDIYEKFVSEAAHLAKERKVGNPFDITVQQGPQIDERMMNKVLGYIETAKKEGAKLEAGGKRIGNDGFFLEPTVFSNVTDDMTIAQEEIFGPVQSIFKFKTLEEVLERANRSNYGLASGVFTNDLTTALVFAKGIEAGQVWVNTYAAIIPQAPFGGYKESGHGRELGEDGVKHYLETKTITIKLPENTN